MTAGSAAVSARRRCYRRPAVYLRNLKTLLRRSSACLSSIRRPLGTIRAAPSGMANRSSDERVASLESSMGGKTLEEHFREHAELIDRRFGEVHARFAAQDKRFDAIDALVSLSDLTAQFVSRSTCKIVRHFWTSGSIESTTSLRRASFAAMPWMLILKKLEAASEMTLAVRALTSGSSAAPSQSPPAAKSPRSIATPAPALQDVARDW